MKYKNILSGLYVIVSLLTAIPALAQIPCPEPLDSNNSLRKLNEDFTNNVTIPLIDHNAGGFGPILTTYIAGQARGESLGSMKDEKDHYHDKAGNNLWNIQKEPPPQAKGAPVKSFEQRCEDMGMKKGPTIDKCLPQNASKDPAEKGSSSLEKPCWKEDGILRQFVFVCKPSYPSLENAADEYLKMKQSYSDALNTISKTNPPSLEDFIKALVDSGWSARVQTPADKKKYIKETKDNISDALRGISEVRDTAENQLNDLKKEIESWCALPGLGSADQRDSLQQHQNDLLAKIAKLDQVCLRPKNPDGTYKSAPPTANKNINECRTKPPAPEKDNPEKTVPKDNGLGSHDNKKPGSRIAAVGEPHYFLPSGASFSTQHAGEFWLVKTNRGVNIQVRQEPWLDSESVAAISAIAIDTGTHRIGFYIAKRQVFLDGRPLSFTGSFAQQELGGGHVLGVWLENGEPEVVAVMLADGSTFRMIRRSSWMDVDYQIMRSINTLGDAGLVGRADVSHENDYVNKDGTRLENPDHNQINDFVNSWRINAEESIFDYDSDKPAAYFNRADFPEKPVSLTAEELAEAENVCKNAGVSTLALAACSFDIAVTKDMEFLQSHLMASNLFHETPRTTSPKEHAKKATANDNSLTIYKTHVKPDIEHAITLENGQITTVIIGANEEKTYLIYVAGEDVEELFVTSHQMTCIQNPYNGETAGYQLFFGEDAISKSIATCSDVKSVKIKPGKYYLVLVGATSGDPETVKFEAFYH